MTLSDLAIKRPVFTTMVSLGIIVLGVMGFFRLGVNLFPDVQFPVVTVATIYPGASPTEIETQVTKKLEDSLASIAGIKQIISFSRDSVSHVVVLFELDVDVKEAATDVRERVSQVRAQLPRDTQEPTVSRMDIAASPIMTYTLSGRGDVQALRDYAEHTIKPRLEQVSGVASVNVLGGRERQINVLLDLDRVRALGMTPVGIADRIRMENLSVPAGNFDEGTRLISVRTLGEMRSVRDLRELPVGVGRDGSITRLGDLGEVVDGFADQESEVRSNGQAAVVLEVQKASGENTVETAQRVRDRLASIRMPAGTRPNLIIDQSQFIEENIADVEESLVFGGAMAILVILFFLLDWRSTFISSLALPTSVLGAFFLMWIGGFTLNTMTLLGLSLAIGLLIDDSIVVRENIMKHLERGADPITAAQEGTREITLAVLATTATLCAVFVPVAFTGGIVGQFFREFGLTIAGATIISAWVALTLDPMLSARIAKQLVAGEHGQRERGFFATLTRPLRAVFAGMDTAYGVVLAHIVARKRWMFLVAVAAGFVLFGSFSLMGLMGSDFMAAEDRGQFLVDIEMPAGTRLEEMSRLSIGAEQELKRDPRFVTIYARIGVNRQSNTASYRVVAVPKGQRTVTQAQLQDITRAVVGRHFPGGKVVVTDPSIVEGAREYPMAFYVQGDDFAALDATSRRFREILRGIPGTKDVDIQYSPGSPELQVAVRRDRAAQLGVPAAMIARTVRASIEGEVAGVYRDGDDEVDIRVRLDQAARDTEARVRDVPVQTMGGLVPLSDVAEIGRGDGPAVIQRNDRQRVIIVTAAPSGRSLGDVVKEFQAAVARETLPAGVTWSLEGTAKTMNESNDSLVIALLLGLVFIYLVLASQFESFIHPVTIMMALPLALVGAILALFLQGSAMSMGASIGIILLMGLVTKNGILLVDHAVTRVREDGMTPKEAILAAGPARLRPILMTSAAMVLGMLPTALGTGPGSEFRSPMAMGVIGGVISSTFMTLLVVPVFYLTVESIERGIRRLFGSRKRAPSADADQ
jgi:hydrophobe/amphiphile efflux-1 (HAE1) family protein